MARCGYSRMFWMSYFLLLTLVLVAILVSAELDTSTVMTSYDENDVIDCVLDDDGTNGQLSYCLNIGRNFLNKYLKHLRKKKMENFNTCTEFTKFDECITPLLEKCHAIRHELRHHWTPFIERMRCSCNGGSGTACQNNVACFEAEYRSVLSSRCYDMYKFNLRQQTRHRCHFLTEKIHCTYGLVDSRCGTETGDLAFHISMLSELDQIERGRCYIKKDPNYDTFRYEENTCPQDFLKQMDGCLHGNLKDDNMLYFHAENDLVVDGSPRKVKKACRDFKKYRQCTRPIRKNCKSGTALVFQYMETLRTYNMKLNYICGDNQTAYTDNVQCYQDIIRNKTLTQCNNIWSELKPVLDNLTAQQFYCQPEHKQTQKLQSELERLTGCYKEIFSQQCGADGGMVFTELIKIALQDPFYLRFTYKPNCEVHREQTESDSDTATPRPVNDGGSDSRPHRPRDHDHDRNPDDKKPSNPVRTGPSNDNSKEDNRDKQPSAGSSRTEREDTANTAVSVSVKSASLVLLLLTHAELFY